MRCVPLPVGGDCLWWAWGVDWESMLADLESRFEAERRTELAAHSAELAEAETAAVTAADRLRGAVGGVVRLRTRSGLPVDGVVRRAGPAYVVVDEGQGLQAVVPVDGLATVTPLPRPAPPEVRRLPTLGSLLRETARRGVRVRLYTCAGEVVGRLARVGADHVDVALDPEGAGRPGYAAGALVTTVMLPAVEILRSR